MKQVLALFLISSVLSSLAFAKSDKIMSQQEQIEVVLKLTSKTIFNLYKNSSPLELEDIPVGTALNCALPFLDNEFKETKNYNSIAFISTKNGPGYKNHSAYADERLISIPIISQGNETMAVRLPKEKPAAIFRSYNGLILIKHATGEIGACPLTGTKDADEVYFPL